MEIDKQLVANTIKKIRISKGLTMEEFGKKVDFAHKSLVSKWEKGMSLPNNKRINIIADLGGISTDELLFGDLKKRITLIANNYYRTQIKQTQTDEFKIFYDPDKLSKLIENVYAEVDSMQRRLDTLYTDSDITAIIIQFMNREIDKEKYLPISNENATYYALDVLSSAIKKVDNYFSLDNVEIEKLSSAGIDISSLELLHYSKKPLNPDLDISTYNQLIISIENCMQEIKDK